MRPIDPGDSDPDSDSDPDEPFHIENCCTAPIAIDSRSVLGIIGDDVGGVQPCLTRFRGARLVVRREDAERARDILEDSCSTN